MNHNTVHPASRTARFVRAAQARRGVMPSALVALAGLVPGACQSGPSIRADSGPVNTGLNALASSDRPVANVPADLGAEADWADSSLDDRIRQQALDLEALLAGAPAVSTNDPAAADDWAETSEGSSARAALEAGSNAGVNMGLAGLETPERVELAAPTQRGVEPSASLGLGAFDDAPTPPTPAPPSAGTERPRDALAAMQPMDPIAIASPSPAPGGAALSGSSLSQPISRTVAPQPTPVDPMTEASEPIAPGAPARSAGALAAEVSGLASQGESPAFREALVALADGLRSSGQLAEPDPTAAGALSPAERRTIDALRAALGEMRATGGDPSAAGEALRRASDTLREQAGVRLPRAVLCRKVDGFGSFVPFERDAFLAGRVNPALVYVEVDRFTHRPATRRDGATGDDGFAIELTQELLLHHKADGRLAWRMPAQRVIETSRNRRQDFYLVTRIDLPANLSVGSYELKVVVTDPTSSTTDETIIPIGIVADPALAVR